VPRHEAIAENEIADLLARIGSEQPFIGPEPASASQLELPKEQSGNERTEITK
jgi:hypothetical protein